MSNITYEAWKNTNNAFLPRLSDKQVLLTYSGGKDSSVVLHLIQQAAKEYGFTFEAHGAVFPKHVLTDAEQNKLSAYWSKRGVRIHWHTVNENDARLESALEDGISPCLICNQTKKKVIMDYFSGTNPNWHNVVLIVSYSLWDIVSATIEHILAAVYADSSLSKAARGKSSSERFMETSQRFYPWLKLQNGLTVFKPLIKYNDQEINNFIDQNRIPLSSPVCSYKNHRPKRILADYYHKMDLHFTFDKVLQFARSALDLPNQEFYSQLSSVDYLKKMI